MTFSLIFYVTKHLEPNPTRPNQTAKEQISTSIPISKDILIHYYSVDGVVSCPVLSWL